MVFDLISPRLVEGKPISEQLRVLYERRSRIDNLVRALEEYRQVETASFPARAKRPRPARAAAATASRKLA